MKILTTPVDAAKHAERIAEMGQALAHESDLADTLATALRWYLADQSIGHRQACVDALQSWEEARRV